MYGADAFLSGSFSSARLLCTRRSRLRAPPRDPEVVTSIPGTSSMTGHKAWNTHFLAGGKHKLAGFTTRYLRLF